MRIHSNILTESDIYLSTVKLPGVYVEVTAHGSRARKGAFEVRLTGTSTRRTMDNRDQAATWDEWGVFFATLFDLDPDMIAGSVKTPNYADADDFHHKTGQRFMALRLPADTHQQHRWEYAGGLFECAKCSATLNNR